MIEIDGSFGSGGGQILRSAVSLSAVMKKPCHVFNIRKNRPKPGLAFQHLLGIQALARFCQGKLEGDFLGSEEIWFYPGEIEDKEIHVNIETAGSITLVLQTLMPPALFAFHSAGALTEQFGPELTAEGLSRMSSGQVSPIKINFNGGATDTFFSPTMDYFQFVFLKILEKLGVKAEINILKKGYYPEGGARVEVMIFHSKLGKIDLTERGKLKKITVISGAADFLKDKKVAERQLAGVKEILGKLKLPIEEKVEYYKAQCPGSQVCLAAEFEETVIGTDNLGKLGKRAEDVGKEAALELLKEQKSGACLDKHLTDQILPYLALASAKCQVSVSEITDHCETNIWVIEKFIDGKFETSNNLIVWKPDKQ